MNEISYLSAPALPAEFYRRPTPEVARDLIGVVLVRAMDGEPRAGRIVETEAYGGPEDLASHAARNANGRARVMFGPVGHAYVYFIYGMHNCLNVVAAEDGRAGAVLIRALEPLHGVAGATNGPGRLCRALEIDRTLNRAPLSGPALRLLGGPASDVEVAVGRRIGVDYAGEWAERPWRYWVKGNRWVSGSTAPSPRSRTDRPR